MVNSDLGEVLAAKKNMSSNTVPTQFSKFSLTKLSKQEIIEEVDEEQSNRQLAKKKSRAPIFGRQVHVMTATREPQAVVGKSGNYGDVEDSNVKSVYMKGLFLQKFNTNNYDVSKAE